MKEIESHSLAERAVVVRQQTNERPYRSQAHVSRSGTTTKGQNMTTRFSKDGPRGPSLLYSLGSHRRRRMDASSVRATARLR